MGMRVQILGSSSSGNCAIVETAGARILIDAGFSARRICAMLDAAGIDPGALDAVFVTHEHSDHVCGLAGLRRYGIPAVYANAPTIAGLPTSARTSMPWRVFETGATFTFRDLEISSFLVPHDAMEPVGFVFTHGGTDLFQPRRSLAWVTDLGFVPELVRARVRSCDLLVLEANHDLDLLEQDAKRPWPVKQRIRGRHGHLSNGAALDLLETEIGAAWRRVLLGHLSRDCNDPALVRRVFSCGEVRPGRSYEVEVIDPTADPGPWIAVGS